jgi:hypothetical protein
MTNASPRRVALGSGHSWIEAAKLEGQNYVKNR